MGAEGRATALHTPVLALAVDAQPIPTTLTAIDLVQPVDTDVGAAALLAILLHLVCSTRKNRFRLLSSSLHDFSYTNTTMELSQTMNPSFLLTMHAHRRSITIHAELLALPVLAQSLTPALAAVTLGLAMHADHGTLALTAVALHNHHRVLARILKENAKSIKGKGRIHKQGEIVQGGRAMDVYLPDACCAHKSLVRRSPRKRT